MAKKKPEQKERPQRGGEILLIDLNKVDIIPDWNRRMDYGDIDELARNIQENGIRIALKGHMDRESGKYLISSGHRRLRALRLLAKKGIEIRVPIISDARESEEERLLSQITDNSGKRFNPVEEADVINRLGHYGYDDAEIARKTGFTKVYICNLKLLGSAPKKLKDLIMNNVVKSTLAMKILREEKDFGKAQQVIESAIEIVSKESEGTKKKITQKDINKSKGKVNSYSELKKTFKRAEKKELTPRPDKRHLYDFIKGLNDGVYSYDVLIKELFEPEVIKEKPAKKNKNVQLKFEEVEA